MPEEMESPVEALAEELHHEAQHGHEPWLKLSAVLSALFAVLAAISGLNAGHYANDAMIEQIESSDQWGYYQAKSIKAMVVESQQNILLHLDKTYISIDDNTKIDRYRGEQAKIKVLAEEKTEAAKKHLEQHEVFSHAVTLFQVSIAMIAIAVLARRREFLGVSVFMGLVGIYFLILGFIG